MTDPAYETRIAPLPDASVIVTILATGAYKAALTEIITAFTAETGHACEVTYDSAIGVGKRIEAGAGFAVVITTSEVMQILVEKLYVAPQSLQAAGSNATSLGYRRGRYRPDVTTPESLKAVLLSVGAIALSDPALGGASSQYFMSVVEKIGIADVLAPKLVLTKGGQGALPVGEGRAEVCIAQTSEIAFVDGLDAAPLLPNDPASRSLYLAGSAATPNASNAAEAFIAFLTRPETAALRKRHGLESS